MFLFPYVVKKIKSHDAKRITSSETCPGGKLWTVEASLRAGTFCAIAWPVWEQWHLVHCWLVVTGWVLKIKARSQLFSIVPILWRDVPPMFPGKGRIGDLPAYGRCSFATWVVWLQTGPAKLRRAGVSSITTRRKKICLHQGFLKCSGALRKLRTKRTKRRMDIWPHATSYKCCRRTQFPQSSTNRPVLITPRLSSRLRIQELQGLARLSIDKPLKQAMI